jgi:ABC-type dipeptide/oligopeptide/nickel transport system permease component
MLALEVVPGDPAAMLLGQGATQEMVQRLRAQLRLDDPFIIRYARYLGRLSKGDLGRSIVDGRPVAAEIGPAWIATAQLGVAAFGLAVAIGIPLGVLTARFEKSLFDNLLRVISLFGLSMPVFWTGIVLILAFSLWLTLLPSGGRGSWSHLILPSVALSIPSAATLLRVTRAATLDILREDYIRTARSKGLPERSVFYNHAFRNALIPVVTVLGLQMGQLLGGAILTETVFAWPGLGRLVVAAIFSRDYILLEGGVLVLALTFAVTNLIVDVMYAFFDPRITYG